MKDSSEFNCLESTPEKSIEITAKGANNTGRPVTGQWEKNANEAKGKHSSFKRLVSRWTLMRSLAVVTTDASSRYHFFMTASVANMPNLFEFVWLLAVKSELVLPASRAGETRASSQLAAVQQCLASTALKSFQEQACIWQAPHARQPRAHVPPKPGIIIPLLSGFHPQSIRRLETKDHSQLVEIPPLSHCLRDAADGHASAQRWQLLNSDANRFTMETCPSSRFPTREKSCVLGREKLGRLRPQLLYFQVAHSFQFRETTNDGWWSGIPRWKSLEFVFGAQQQDQNSVPPL